MEASIRSTSGPFQEERVTLPLTHFLFSTSSCLQGSQTYLRARVTLAGRLTFGPVNTPGRVNPPNRVVALPFL